MTINERSAWPTVDEAIAMGATGGDLDFARMTQPNAIAETVSETVGRLMWALDAFRGMEQMYLNSASVLNALDQLPEDKSELLKRQLALSERLWEDRGTGEISVVELDTSLRGLYHNAANVKWGHSIDTE